MPKVLDPTKIDSTSTPDSAMLARLLRATTCAPLLHAGMNFIDGESRESFILTHSILNIPKLNPRTGKREPHYYIFSDTNDNTLGKGTYGRVVKIQGTISLTTEGRAVFKAHQTGKTRVLKIASLATNNFDPKRTTQSQLECETDKQQRLATTHTKGPVIARDESDSETLGFMLCAEFDGHDLREHLAQDKRNQDRKLSIAQRFQLTLNIIRAYIEQIHNNKLIHRDIKPENIMIDSATGAVNFIDFGFAIDRDDNDGENIFLAGTPVYMAPEVILEKAYSQASDLYALGAIIAEVWQSDPMSQKEIDRHYGKSASDRFYGLIAFHTDFTEHTSEEHYNQILHQHLFRSITDAELASAHKNTLKKIIRGLLHPIPEKRSGPNLAYRALKELEITVNTSDPDKAALLKHANRIGLSAYHQLRDVSLYSSKNSFSDMLKAVSKIDKVANDPAAIRTFLAALGVQALQTNPILHAADSKLAVKNEAKEIIQTFIDNINRLLLLQQVAEITQAQLKKELQPELQSVVTQLFGEINVLWHKERRANVALDELVQLNQRFTQSMPTLTRLAEALPQAHPIGAIANRDQRKHRLGMYQQLVARLAKPYDQVDPALAKLSQQLRAAIQSYLQQTMSKRNLKKNDRAGSLERLTEMTALLNTIETATTTDQLTAAVHAQLNSLSRVGLFGSRFKKNIAAALATHQAKKPILG